MRFTSYYFKKELNNPSINLDAFNVTVFLFSLLFFSWGSSLVIFVPTTIIYNYTIEVTLCLHIMETILYEPHQIDNLRWLDYKYFSLRPTPCSIYNTHLMYYNLNLPRPDFEWWSDREFAKLYQLNPDFFNGYNEILLENYYNSGKYSNSDGLAKFIQEGHKKRILRRALAKFTKEHGVQRQKELYDFSKDVDLFQDCHFDRVH